MCWSILLKVDRDLQFFSDDRFSSWNVNMAKIYERLLSKNILREKSRDSFDPQRVNLLGEDNICMVNLLVREVLFCQASMKIKMSPLSVHC